MMTNPAISVVMAVYNNMPFLPLAVESILRQSYRDFEFIIIDDGSTDGGGEWLEEAARGDFRIRLKRRENWGLTKSLNEGCTLARGEFIARMDGDDISYPNRFERQVRALERQPELVALGAQVRYIDEKNTPLFIRSVPLQHEEIERCHLATWGGVVIHPVAMLRRKAFEATGGYDESFECAQDYDLWFRIGRVGRIANLPDVLLDYRRHTKAVGSASKTKQAQAVKIVRNRELSLRGLTVPLPMPEKFQVFPNDLTWLLKASSQNGFIKSTFYASIRLLGCHILGIFNCVRYSTECGLCFIKNKLTKI